MSYTKLTDFASKDALLTGNPSKLLRGTELGAEFDAIEVADALNIKPDTVTAATGKTTPVDADLLTLFDSASTFSLKKLTWANLKVTVKTYFDTLYARSGANTDITSLTGIINGLGYAVGVGAGGSVTQNTSKTTAVTLNKLTGTILTASTSMTGPNGQTSFTCNNSLVGMRDLVIANVANSGVYGDYFVTATALNGSIIFTLRLSITGTLAEQVNIAFAVIKGSVT